MALIKKSAIKRPSRKQEDDEKKLGYRCLTPAVCGYFDPFEFTYNHLFLDVVGMIGK